MHTFIRAPIEKVWAWLSNHEGYARIPGVERARLLVEGKPERNGLGAVREIKVMGSVFEEEITRFEPPNRMGYRILRSRPLHIDHEGGDMRLVARDGGTELDWTTTMAVRMPVVGWIMTKILGMVVQRKFDQLLSWAKKDLESAYAAESAASPPSSAAS
jgi:uncharacterized protein YndB with AHSA1/START domain